MKRTFSTEIPSLPLAVSCVELRHLQHGGNISHRTLRRKRTQSETPCISPRRCADKKAALHVRRAA